MGFVLWGAFSYVAPALLRRVGSDALTLKLSQHTGSCQVVLRHRAALKKQSVFRSYSYSISGTPVKRTNWKSRYRYRMIQMYMRQKDKLQQSEFMVVRYQVGSGSK